MTDKEKQYLRECAQAAGAGASDMEILESYLQDNDEDAARGLIWSLSGD
jgi:hypothetical protein